MLEAREIVCQSARFKRSEYAELVVLKLHVSVIACVDDGGFKVMPSEMSSVTQSACRALVRFEKSFRVFL